MKRDPLPSLRDTLLRRELTAAETRELAAWFAAHPDAGSLAEELALARALHRLPPAPVPSNFNARVLADLRREPHVPSMAAFPRESLVRRWLSFAVPWPMPRATASALAVALVLALGLGGWRWHSARQQAEFTRNVAALRVLAAVNPEVLEDFDTIRQFGETDTAIDFELLAALQ